MALLEFKTEDFQNWERHYRGRFFNSLGGFKSLNLVATRSAEGVNNLATMFSVIHVGADPPLMGMLFRPHTVPRHTLENIRESSAFTINSVPRHFLKKAHQASAKYHQHESEFKAIGLEPVFRQNSFAPFVKGSPVQFAVTFEEEHLIEANKTIFVVGRIQYCQIEEESLLEDGFIDHSRVESLLVNGLDTYYSASLEKRLEYATPGNWSAEK